MVLQCSIAVGVICMCLILSGCDNPPDMRIPSEGIWMGGEKGGAIFLQTYDLKQSLGNYDEPIKTISPLSKPLKARALVVVPSRSLLEAKLKGPDKPSWKRLKRITEFYSVSTFWSRRGIPLLIPNAFLDNKTNEFILTGMEKEWEAMGEAVKKRGIFDKVEIQRSDTPNRVPLDDHDSIFYVSSNLRQWFMVTKNQTAPEPVYIDWSKTKPSERAMSWLTYIEVLLSGK